jgi:Ca2+-transporting ATPase
VNDAVSKFLQFQITVNITAVTLAFVSAVVSPDNKSVLSAVQLLWVNLIMDTFAALALATDAPTEKILDRKPTPKAASLITTNMWKMILGQALYQIVITFTLHFAGATILSYDITSNPELQAQLKTMVFNTFVWMQIFNQFNNRRLDNRLNIFEGVLRNYFFLAINAVMIGSQILIIFVGGLAFQVTAINGGQWAICILLSAPCLVWAVALRCISDRYAAAVFDAAATAWMTIYYPIAHGLRVVFAPVARVCKAVNAPVRRAFCRAMAKMLRTKRVAMADNEALRAPVSSSAKEGKRPMTAQNLPPITLTQMD